MKTVSISVFRARLLNYLSNVQHGEVINVTSKGTVLATLSPPVCQQDAARKKLDDLAKTAVIHDAVSPIEEDWDAMK
jgi:antitoxin (DNA-binding transcriptional repressor) of toxin-antitoxin stability system